MAFRDPNWAQGSSGYTAEEDRQVLAALAGARQFTSFTPAVSSVNAGGGHGVVGDGDYLVTANGTPNDTVHVAIGQALVKGSTQTDQGPYVTGNDADAVITVPTADTANPRRDLIVVRVRDNEYDAGGQNKADAELVQGTPAGTPVDPAVPASSLVIARIRVPAVPAGPTVITSSEIDDLRTWAYGLGGIALGTSTTRPNPAVRRGQIIYEHNTKNLLVWNGTEWLPPWNTAWGKIAEQELAVNGSALASAGGPTLSDFSLPSVAVRGDRLYEVTLKSRAFISASSEWELRFLVDATNTQQLSYVDSVTSVDQWDFNSDILWKPTAGTKALTIDVIKNSGTGTITFSASTVAKRWFYVKDIGPR